MLSSLRAALLITSLAVASSAQAQFRPVEIPAGRWARTAGTHAHLSDPHNPKPSDARSLPRQIWRRLRSSRRHLPWRRLLPQSRARRRPQSRRKRSLHRPPRKIRLSRRSAFAGTRIRARKNARSPVAINLTIPFASSRNSVLAWAKVATAWMIATALCCVVTGTAGGAAVAEETLASMMEKLFSSDAVSVQDEGHVVKIEWQCPGTDEEEVFCIEVVSFSYMTVMEAVEKRPETRCRGADPL